MCARVGRSSLRVPPHSLPWYRIWWLAAFRPSESTYAKLLDGFNQESKAPLAWIFVSFTLSLVFASARGLFADSDPAIRFICAPIGLGVGAVVVWVILVGFISLIARRVFKGEGNNAQLFYLSTAVLSPLLIAIGLLWLIIGAGSLVAAVSTALELYQMALITLAVKVIHRLSWWKSALAVVPLLSLVLFL